MSVTPNDLLDAIRSDEANSPPAAEWMSVQEIGLALKLNRGQVERRVEKLLQAGQAERMVGLRRHGGGLCSYYRFKNGKR